MRGLEERSNLSFRVARQLGRGIVCGEFDPGEPFPTEAELAGEFGVSRTAIREAVKMLAAKGLVASRPRQGIRIQPAEAWNLFDAELLRWMLEGSLSRSVLREFFQMRVAIEPEAAAIGADLGQPQRLQAVREALDRMLGAPGGTEESRRADIDFHVAVLYATENRFYIGMRDFIRTALDVSIRFTTSESVAYADTLDQHAAVHRAMQRRQPDAARRAMRQLIDEAVARL